MNTLLIGDCHFGIKTNSFMWLNIQIKFFNTQVIKSIKENNIQKVVILGDMFDIRYSINQTVGIEVKEMLRKLLKTFPDVKFYILAGNHDFYSPIEDTDYYNAYDLVFGKEFYNSFSNLKMIIREPYLDESDNSLFLPWYWTENSDHFDEILYRYHIPEEVKCIYCHTDLSTWPGARITFLKGIPVYSGHIHYIIEDEFTNLHNIGAAFPLTFSDVNQERYLYVIDDNFKIINKIQNTTTPMFYRIFNEEIFKVDDNLFENNNYIQLCISSSNTNKAKYKEQIKNIKTKFINSNIAVHIIDSEDTKDIISAEGFNTNINEYIKDNIPDKLDEKYNLIKNKIEENK